MIAFYAKIECMMFETQLFAIRKLHESLPEISASKKMIVRYVETQRERERLSSKMRKEELAIKRDESVKKEK